MISKMFFLDTWQPEQKWTSINIQGDLFPRMLGQVACLPYDYNSKSTNDHQNFLIFGGIPGARFGGGDKSYSKSQFELKIEEKSLNDPVTGQTTTYIEIRPKFIEQEIQYHDRIYHNQYFYHVSEDERKKYLLVPSRMALHIFDNTDNRLVYLKSDRSRRYETLAS